MKIFIRRTIILVIFVLGMFYNLFAILFSLSLMRIIDSIISATEKLQVSILLAILSLIVSIVLSVLLTVLKNKYAAFCITKVKEKLVDAICEMPASKYFREGKESFESFFVNDLKLLEEQYIRKVLDVVTSVSQFVLSIIALALLEPIFLLLPLVVITLSIMTPIVFKGIVGKCNIRYSEASNKFITMFGELLSGITVIKNFSASNFIASRVKKAVMSAEYSYASYLNSISLANISFVFAGQLLLLLSFSIGGTMAATGLITVGSIIYISQLLLYTIEPLAVFAGAGTSYASVKITIEKCTDLLSFKTNENDLVLDNFIASSCIEGDISIENLRIVIPETNTIVLDGISMTLHQGKKYALIGKNGSGKSTLLKVLTGGLVDYSGEIHYNGIDVKDIHEEVLNSVVTYSPQDNFVFSVNLYENIFLNECVHKEEQMWVLRNLDRFQLKIDPNHIISEKEISGGERAKICLLRSLTRNSRYLFFDEPTAAMDEKSCSVFDEVLSSLHDILCIVVTHRIDSSLKNYDSVVVLDNGKIVAIDDYDNLLKKGII